MAYRNVGLRLLGELGTAPEWASYFDPVIRCDSGYFKNYFAPRRPEEFARYARTVAQRYRGVIDEWFLWNEPWYAPFFAFGYDKTGKKNPSRYWSAPDAPEQYAALSAAAYDAVKEVNPDAVVCGFNTRGFDPNRWSERVYDAGGMEKMRRARLSLLRGPSSRLSERRLRPGSVAERLRRHRGKGGRQNLQADLHDRRDRVRRKAPAAANAAISDF